MELWQELLGIKSNALGPLLFIGDFNEVLDVSERRCGCRCMGSIQDFAQLV